MTGKMTVGPAWKLPVTLEMKRPKNMRMEIHAAGH